MEKLLSDVSEKKYYCDRLKGFHIDLKNDKSYYCATSTKYGEKINDFSIFTREEWNTLILISEQFERGYDELTYLTEYEYSQLSDKIKGAMTYLRYKCDFCSKSFSELENIFGNKSDILDYILENSRYDSRITFNQFRIWVVENWDKIDENLNILNEYTPK